MAQEEKSRHTVPTIRVGPQGRLVVPAELRRRLDLHEGDLLTARTEGSRLILEPKGEVLRRLRSRYAAVPAGVRLSSELVHDRRQEARRERRE